MSEDKQTGYWRIKIDKGHSTWDWRKYYCTVCGKWQTYGITEYCMHCGSKMEGECPDGDGDSD